MARPALVTVVTLALLATSLAGCIGAQEDVDQQSADEAVPDGDLETSKGWSSPAEPRKYAALPGFQTFLESFDGTEISVGVFLPDVEGCDWNASSLPEDCQVPVVLEGGPYFLDGVAEQQFRPPTVEWLVTRGYAVVQMSLRGTGESGGCFEFKNPADVKDVDATIDWIADQPWSTGKVGMIGRSYDGTAAWAGAASGNEHLETIVPISGAVDGPHLYYKNGTSEGRGFAQPTFYYLFAFGLVADDPSYRVEDWPGTLCAEAGEDWVRGPKAGATGDASSDYWQARDLADDILERYEGSAWVIHGLKDWNVNPSQAVPFTREMREAGIPTLTWLGQWDHAYPDRVDEHRNVRWDWAQKVVDWFDFYLEGEGERPWLGAEVEDSQYNWRKEEAFPPPDARWEHKAVSDDGELAPPEEAQEGAAVLAGGAAGGNALAFASEPLDEAKRVSGLPRFHVTVEPTTPAGGELFAELYDVWPDGTTTRLTWAAMNLRFHEGGNTDPATLVPGEPVTARMQFEPVDALVAEDHRLRLVVHKSGVEDVTASEDPEPNVVHLGSDSLLRLPTVDRPTEVEGTAPTVGNVTDGS
jgi:predicted acyl esterase